jgi:hypothetical protein
MMQTAISDKLRFRINRRYVVLGRRRYDPRAMRDREYIRHHDNAASRLAPKGRDAHFDLSVAVGAMVGATLSDRAAVSSEGI